MSTQPFRQDDCGCCREITRRTFLKNTTVGAATLAAAGPLWNPPVATSTAKAPLALLIDDGFPAAGTWDARMRTVEELIARAEADNRGVALVPLSEPSRDVSFETPAAARVRLKQIKPKPHAVERVRAHISAGRCACEVRNPRGACCLGDVTNAVEYLRQLNSKTRAHP